MKENTLRPCQVNDKNAYFHRWTDISQVIPPSNLIGGHSGGQLSHPFGIVEYIDGKIEMVSPEKIRFIDNPNLYVMKD